MQRSDTKLVETNNLLKRYVYMIWIIIIGVVAGYFLWDFKNKSKQIVRKNEARGGMKELFPEFVHYFETDGFELVESSGKRLIYRKHVRDDFLTNDYLFLGIESVFSDIAFGYVIDENGKKTTSLNVKFTTGGQLANVDKIMNPIIHDLISKGVL